MVSPSVKDVAALAKVSIGTVSNVLNRPQAVSPQTTERVTRAIEKLAYVRNEAARQLRLGQSNAVGVITLSGSNPFFAALTTAAEDTAAAAGFTVITGNSNEKKEREARYLNLFEELRVHGILISPVGIVIPRLRQLRARGIPTVLVDRVSTDLAFSSVSVDDAAGGALAATHLIESGCRRIAMLGGPRGIRQVSDRLRGARQSAAENAGVTFEFIQVDGLSIHEGKIAGEEIGRRSHFRRPDGIFAANDLLAIGLLQALHLNRDISIPDQIALIGYDDILFASASVVPLTSIRQPTGLIGETAMKILLEEAEDSNLSPRQIVFQPEIVIRASSGH